MFLKHAEQNNLFFVVKRFGGLLSPENLRVLSSAVFVCAQAEGKLEIVAMGGMIDGDEECSTLPPHQCYGY